MWTIHDGSPIFRGGVLTTKLRLPDVIGQRRLKSQPNLSNQAPVRRLLIAAASEVTEAALSKVSGFTAFDNWRMPLPKERVGVEQVLLTT